MSEWYWAFIDILVDSCLYLFCMSVYQVTQTTQDRSTNYELDLYYFSLPFPETVSSIAILHFATWGSDTPFIKHTVGYS